MAGAFTNPLLSTKPSDSNLSASIHPLALLTVSDHITRQQVRAQKGPIVGALLGQLHGRLVTAEYAFPCNVIEDTEGQWLLDQEWMERRIQQFKDVHKVPALEVTGLYTLCPETGPTSALVLIHKQAITLYNESSILLTIHPSAIATAASTTADGKLPISVYEGITEADSTKEDSSMQVDGESSLIFRNIPYSVDTDETEMIAINYVAKGAGNAAAADGGEQPSPSTVAEKKGKKKADTNEDSEAQTINGTKDSSSMLAPEEEDRIAGLTTRLNSVRMLQSRLSLMSKFLQSQPPSYLSDASVSMTTSSPDPAQLPHLRNIQALLTRLNLLTPKTSSSSPESLMSSSEAQHNDVQLSQLLSLLGQDIQGMGEMGRKFATVDNARQSKKGNKGFMMGHGPTDSFGQDMDWDQGPRRGEAYSMAPF